MKPIYKWIKIVLGNENLYIKNLGEWSLFNFVLEKLLFHNLKSNTCSEKQYIFKCTYSLQLMTTVQLTPPAGFIHVSQIHWTKSGIILFRTHSFFLWTALASYHWSHPTATFFITHSHYFFVTFLGNFKTLRGTWYGTYSLRGNQITLYS